MWIFIALFWVFYLSDFTFLDIQERFKKHLLFRNSYAEASYFLPKLFRKIFPNSEENSCTRVSSVKVQAAAPILKTFSNAGVCLWILRDFSDQLFYNTSANSFSCIVLNKISSALSLINSKNRLLGHTNFPSTKCEQKWEHWKHFPTFSKTRLKFRLRSYTYWDTRWFLNSSA